MSAALGPFLYRVFQCVRLFRGKEDAARRHERYGIATCLRPKGRIVWFHAASNGECLSALPLIHSLVSRYPDLNFLVTSGTLTSARLMEKKLPASCIHQFVPYDVPKWIDRFLGHWKPDLFIGVESEFWPNLLQGTSIRQIPMILLNGRMSSRSYHSWLRYRESIKKLLGQFSLVLAQSDEHAARLRTLGANHVEVRGNIKFASHPPDFNPSDLEILQQQTHSRFLWVAASTHKGEEEMVASVHLQLRKNFPGLLTIIIPRHPSRSESILALMKTKELKVARRSRGQIIRNDTDIYLADTTGETGLFFRLAQIVFMGGSLVKIGGHNLIEPALLDTAIIHGPHMHKQKEMMAFFEGSTCLVDSVQELHMVLDRLLRDRNACINLAQKAKSVAENQKQILSDVLFSLDPYVRNLVSS